MSCYYPWLVRIEKEVEDGVTDERFLKKKVHFIGKFNYDSDAELVKSGLFKVIPCGKCIGCKLDYARTWADRLVLEMMEQKKGVFITLTYENSRLPNDVDPETGEVFENGRRVNGAGAPVAPLCKYDLSQFNKKLRSNLNYKETVERFRRERPELINNPDGKPFVRLKFFAAGEYGERFGRPHYHEILFGLSLDDLKYLGNLIPHDRNELGQETFRSEYLEKVWQNGIVGVSEANYLTMGYTARYTTKKALGNDYPGIYGLPEEFTLMSRRPGIGASFINSHKGITDQVSTWYIPNSDGKEIYWPKYIREKEHEHVRDIENLKTGTHMMFHWFSDSFYKDKEKRQNLSITNLVNEYEYDERSYSQKRDFLKDQKLASVKKLKRGDDYEEVINKIKSM